MEVSVQVANEVQLSNATALGPLFDLRPFSDPIDSPTSRTEDCRWLVSVRSGSCSCSLHLFIVPSYSSLLSVLSTFWSILARYTMATREADRISAAEETLNSTPIP